MTPKEKAKQLVDKYATYSVMWTGGVEVTKQNCKQCALIAIDEQIKLYNEINEYGHLLPNSFGFELHEIKTEIEKL